MPPALVVRDLRKAYRAGLGQCRARVQVLCGVSFSLAEGERLAIVGAAASGKTTLLHCLAGLRRPDGGEIRWQGQPPGGAARPIHTQPGRLNGVDPPLIDLSEAEHSI